MIQYESTVTSAKRHVDKTVSVTTRSNFEMSTADYMEIDKILQAQAWTLIAPNELQESDVPQEPASSRESKTKAQRLRAVYFLLWKKDGTEEAFDPWFDRKFEQILDKLKERLD